MVAELEDGNFDDENITDESQIICDHILFSLYIYIFRRIF